MSNGQQLSLEILIKTIADNKGIATTEQQIKALADSMRSAAAAGKPLETSTEAVAAALTKSSTAAKQSATGWESLTKEQKESHREAAQSALRQLEAAAAANKAGSAAEKLGRNVNSAKTAFSGLRDVLAGGLTGNIGQLGEGLGKISSAATNATPAMQKLFAAIATGASAAAVVAAPVIVAIAAMNKAAADNQAAMQRMWDQAKASGDAYKVRLAEITAESDARLDAHIAKIQQVSTALDSMISDMDKAQARRAEIDAANKQLELAKATTPEQKAEIESRYGQAALDNKGINADLRIRNVNDTLQGARETQRTAEAELAQAESAFRANPTKEGRAAYDQAKANLDKVTSKNAPVFKAGADQIDAARTTKEVTGIQRQTFSIQQQKSAPTGGTTTAGTSSNFNDVVANGRSRLGAADRELDNIRSQASAAPDNKQLIQKLNETQAYRDALAIAIANNAEREKSANKKTEQKIKNVQRTSGP